MYSHSLRLARKQRKLGSLKMSALKACIGILARAEDKCALPGLHVNLSIKEKTAQLNGLLTGGGLQEILKGKCHYAINRTVPFVASFSDRNVGFDVNRDLTGKNFQCIDVTNKLLVNHRQMLRVERKHLRLWFEFEELKRAVRRVASRNCMSGLYTLKLHLVDHLVEDSERLGNMSLTGAKHFEHIGVLSSQSIGMTSRRLLMSMEDTVQSIEKAVSIVRKTENGVHKSLCKAAGPKMRGHPGRAREHLVRDEIFVLLQRMVKTTDT